MRSHEVPDIVVKTRAINHRQDPLYVSTSYDIFSSIC